MCEIRYRMEKFAAAILAAKDELEQIPGVGESGPDIATLIAAEEAGTVYDYSEYHQAQKAWLILKLCLGKK